MFYYAGATMGGFYLEPFWRWAGWEGVVIGSLFVLGISFSLTLWLGSRKSLFEARTSPVESMQG
jgi:YNFM family putative membrane transporter